MKVRDFEPEDAEEVSQLIIRNLRQVLSQDYPSEAIEALMPSFVPEKLIEHSESEFTLVGTLGNNVVGTAALATDRVRNVFVDVARHKSGIGKGLMAAIEAEARRQQLKRVYLMSGLSSFGFYERLDYRIVKQIDRELNGVPVPVIHMEKELVTE